MRLSAQVPCTESTWATVQARLRDVDTWDDWFVGLDTAQRVGDSLRLVLVDARSAHLDVEVEHHESTVIIRMVEGTPRSLDATLVWSKGEVSLTIDVDLHTPLPGVLARELEGVYPARLLGALVAGAESPPSRCAMKRSMR